MAETFNDKLNRIGYKITNDEFTSEFILQPTASKIVTAVILIFLGLILTPFYKIPIDFIESLFNDSTQVSTNFLMLTISVSATILSIAFLYKGLHRLFDFIGFRILLVNNTLTYSIRNDLKLVKIESLNIHKFDFQYDSKTVTINCIDERGKTHQLIKEKGSVIDTKETLRQLTETLNQQLK